MQIHELKVNKKKSRKRIGRGGKRGTYSGRGMKGQKARSGTKKDPLFEGGRSSLIDRLKKTRGFKSPHPKKVIINLGDLEKNFKDGDAIDIKSLIKSKLISRLEAKRGVKILGNGKLTKRLTVDKNILLSRSVKKAVKNNK